MPFPQLAPMFDPQITAEAERFAASLVAGPIGPDTDADHWNRFCEMGWPLCLFPEKAGGLGADLEVVSSIVEGAGAFAPPLPLVGTLILVPLLLREAPADRVETVISGLADGSCRIVPFLSGEPQDFSSDAQGMVSGHGVSPHAMASPTHALLTLKNERGEPAIGMLALQEGPEASARIQQALDERPSLALTLDRAKVDILVRRDSANESILAAERTGTILSCLEMVAASGAALATTAAFLEERVQFERPLASFQALRHRYASLYASLMNARALVESALKDQGMSSGFQADRQIRLAKRLVDEFSPKVAQEVIQFHGGIGLTEELAVSRLNKRMMIGRFEFGDRFEHSLA